MITLRPAQQRMLTKTQNKMDELANLPYITPEDKAIICDVAPATGKTFGWQVCANWLYQNGHIDSVVVFTPRINLCQQGELDWKRDRPLLPGDTMGPVAHRGNNPPLLRGDQFGYTTTYQSLISEAGRDTHHHFCAKHRVAIVCDEADILAADPDMFRSEFSAREGTKAAEVISELARLDTVKIIFVLSGTMYRNDGRPLILARYTEKDKYGLRYVIPDVRASVQEGIRYGYLTQFEFHLHDGTATSIVPMFETTREYQLSEMPSGLHKILTHREYWQPFVDLVIEKVRAYQAIDSRFCGLIAASSQAHAQDILGYLGKAHPQIKALIAISDEKLAHDNLRKFKRGKHDILITVAMAHVGYDHKPIKVVGCLSAIRSIGWLHQLFARAMRTVPDAPIEPMEQRMLCIVPDDPRMVKTVEALREESERGVRERGGEGPPPPPPPPQPLENIVDADLISSRAMGMDPKTDVPVEEFPYLIQQIRDNALNAAPVTGIKKMLLDHGVDLRKYVHPTPETPVITMSDPHEQLTDGNIEDMLRANIATLCNKITRAVYEQRGIDYQNMPKNAFALVRSALYRELGINTVVGLDKNVLRAIEQKLTDDYWPAAREGRFLV